MSLKYVEGFNVLEVFRHPKKTVKAALEFPNILTAIMLVVIAWILQLMVPAILGLKINFRWQAAASSVAIALFFLQASIIYLIAKSSRNKEKRLFEGIISALSLTQIASILLLVFSLFFLLLNPQIVSLTNNWIVGNILTENFIKEFYDNLFSNIVGIIFVAIGFVLSIYFSLQVLYLNYLSVKESTGKTVFASIIITILILFFIAFLKELILYILQASFIEFFLP